MFLFGWSILFCLPCENMSWKCPVCHQLMKEKLARCQVDIFVCHLV
jgi:hypothetical protein